MFKKRSRVILLTILAVTAIVVAFVVYASLGSSRGLRVGDEFTYDIKVFWSSQDPDAAPSESYFELNMTEWFKVTVTGVSDAEVSINTTWRFNNGTEFERAESVNVETGNKYPSDAFYLIYAANLKTNDLVRPLGFDRSTVNETATRQYASGTRETNRLSFVQNLYDENEPTRTWTEYTNIHFDRQTGVLVELRDTNVCTNPDMTLTLVYTITDSSVWTIS